MRAETSGSPSRLQYRFGSRDRSGNRVERVEFTGNTALSHTNREGVRYVSGATYLDNTSNITKIVADDTKVIKKD